MHRHPLGLIGLAALSLGIPSISSVAEPYDYWAGQSPKYPRGKRAQAKPRKRRNLVTVSKRVRRKHRRAA